MLEIKNITKKFGNTAALDNLSFTIPSGSVFGLIGSNGSGKSTLLRIISGVYQPDGGSVEIDGTVAMNQPEVKEKCFFISDFPYYYNDSTISKMASFYRGFYPSWNEERFFRLTRIFPLNVKDKIINMSKGMQRQASLILAISTEPKYILLDEIFDGLDPVVRQLIKKLLMELVADLGTTVVIASHNLRELEDVCDHVGLLHKGGLILEKDLEDAKLGLFRIQVILEGVTDEELKQKLNIVSLRSQGKMRILTIKGNRQEIEETIQAMKPVYMEMLPLTLEEVFICEMEAVGYDINNLFQ